MNSVQCRQILHNVGISTICQLCLH